MGRKKSAPKYCLHRGTGQARVTVNGKSVYLGKWGTPVSLERYNRLKIEYESTAPPPPESVDYDDLRVVDVLDGFCAQLIEDWGLESIAPGRFIAAARLAVELYGNTLAREFTPRRLKAIRSAMVDAGHCRNTVNAYIRRIQAAFRWGAKRRCCRLVCPARCVTWPH